MKLPARIEKLTADPNYMMHIVDESDTSQDPTGSSFKMKIGLLAGSGGTLDINNTPVANSANTTKNILYSYNVPANTLNNDGDVLEIEGYFTHGDDSSPSYTAFIDTPNFTTGKASGSAATRFLFIVRIVRISATTYTRYSFFQIGIFSSPSTVTHNIACDFTDVFTINFAIQNVGAFSASTFDFSRITLVKAFANGTILNNVTIYRIKKSLTAAQIKTGNSVPIDVGLDLPGVGYAYEVVGASFRLNFGSIAFDASAPALIYADTAPSPQASTNIVIDSPASLFVKLTIFQGSTSQLVENKKLFIQMGSDSTVGDGTADVYIYYSKVIL